MNEMSNNIKFLQEVSERATDPLHPRKLQLQLDLRQEIKKQSEQSGALQAEKNSTFGAHLDEINRIKQEKLDKLNSDIDQMTKSIEETKNAEKETGHIYMSGRYIHKNGCLFVLRLCLAEALLALSIALLITFINCYNDMDARKERYYRMVERE